MANVTGDAWASAFLKAIGAPVTRNNIDNVVAWGIAESGGVGSDQGHGGWTNFNPLNIVTQSGDKHISQGGSQGNIADFLSLHDGVNSSARLFLNNGRAAPIIATLRANGSRSELNGAINQFYGSWGGSIHLAGATGGGKTIGQGPAGGISGSVVDAVTGPAEALGTGLFGAAGSGVFGALGNAAKLELAFFGLFTNWRYVVEVMAGLGLIGVGVLFVLHDTGVTKKVQSAATTAAVAA